MATQTARTGYAVDFIDTPRPAMIFVPCPVVEASAIYLTGLKSVPVYYSVIYTIRPVNTIPVTVAPIIW